MTKLKLVIVLAFSSLMFAQNNTLDSLRNVVSELNVSANKLPIIVTWQWMPLDSALYYDVYYCAANDTNLMPVKCGVNLDSIWDWMAGRTVYNYYWVKRPSTKYLRIGIVGVNKDGKATAMKCMTYVF